MLFDKLFSSFKIDGAMNFLSRQVEFLSQSSDQIKNFVQRKMAKQDKRGAKGLFPAQKMPVTLIITNRAFLG